MTPGTGCSAIGRVTHSPPIIQVRRQDQYSISVACVGGKAFVGVTLGKQYAGGSYEDGGAWIAERFPRLRSLVHEWSQAKLVAELGRGGKATNLPGGPIERDEILVHELMHRDLSRADFRWLLHRPSPADPSRVLRAAVREKAARRFAPFIREYLADLLKEADDRLRFNWRSSMANAISELRGAADLDVSDIVLEWLKTSPRSPTNSSVGHDYLDSRKTKSGEQR
jgi:hypothetical protein